MRANSLTNLGVSLDYNVASDYDKVLVLSGIASEIEALAPHANEIATLVANLPDVLTVQEASELVNNLTVKVTTLPAGSTATSELVGTEIRLGIPAGTQGAQGIQGPKGDKGDKGDIGLTGAKGPAGATGAQGPKGFRGEDGLDGEGVSITSILNNINKSLTINFSDGTQHTTDPLKGEDGRSVTITNVVNNANGTILINFSDGTSHHTADLRGPIGFKGDTGDHVHHISYQRSKDPIGNEVGPTEPGRPGYDDTYAMWTSQEELPETFIGEFVTHNGLNTLTAEEQAKLDSVEFGATRDQEAFEVLYDNSISGLLSEDVQNSIDELSATKLNLIEKGQPNGVASLDSNGLIPASQLPSYVDDVLEYATYAELPVTGEAGKIYIVVADETSGDDTSSYRWTGTVYAVVSNTLTASDVKALYEANPDTNEYSDAEKVLVDVSQVLETTATTLPTAINELVSVKVDKIVGSSLVPDTKVSLYDSHIIDAANPHAVTKAQVGLSNAEDTRDNVKNVLSATKWTTARTITLSGDVTGSVSVDGSANVTMSTTVQPNSVALGTDTTGNYMVGIIAGSGLSVSHTQGEGSTATITNSNPNVTTDITTTHNSTNVVVNSSDGTDGTINAATQTLAGVMSAADKTKLDGIEAGATGDQTANEILTLLNTVDGSGSGLDADLLDGQEGAYYLNASNINAGTIDDTRLPATITSSTIGNASTATKLATPRTINGVSFNGSANITIADSTKVALTGNETIAGIKTFSSSPIVPTPTTNTQATNKQYVDGKYSGFKNYIINGGFDIWQRGTSFTNTTTQGTKLDGNYMASQTPSGTCVLVKDTISYNDTAYNALKATANSINVSSSSFFVFHWSLEGLNTYHLQNKELTMSFLIEVSHSGNYNLNIRKYNSSNAIHKTFAKLIPLVAGVNNVVVNIPADSGEIQNSNNRGLSFVIAGDTNSNSTSVEGWQSGNFATINGARRWWETNGAYVKVAQVQLEEGSAATPFENRPYGLELSLCQRYYEVGSFLNRAYVSMGQDITFSKSFKITKRVDPSLSYTTTTINNGSIYDVRHQTNSCFNCYVVSIEAGGIAFDGTWTASAEL